MIKSVTTIRQRVVSSPRPSVESLPVLTFPLFPRVAPDQVTDGTWAWVDQSPLTLTNWGPGWPQNKDKVWDCGQIFTGSDACRGAVGCGPWAVERGGGGGGGGGVVVVVVVVV